MDEPVAHRGQVGAPAPSADTRAYRRALGSFATGVTVVTCALPDGRRAGLTVNSFASVSLAPPLVSWCLARKALGLALFDAASHFAVNVLAVDQVPLVDHFAQRDLDKFADIEAAPGLGGAPLLDGCAACFECRVAGRHDGGDHVIYLGEVERYRAFEREPLVLVRGRYGRLGG